MGDILRAYELLNRTFKLGLTKEQLFRAEAGFKFDFGRQERFAEHHRKDPGAFLAEWEFKSYLVPRQRPISEQARKSMDEIAVEVAKHSENRHE